MGRVHEGVTLLLLLLVGSVLALALLRRAGLPTIMAYLLVGVVVGPSGLNLIEDRASAQAVAEFGVVFLMFSIGLEFSLSSLRAMRRLVFGLGVLQVLGTMVLLMLIGVTLAGLTLPAAFVLSGALAMSSTAILSKLLTERHELEQPHGREVIGVLLFQDLAVVPLIILLPALGGEGQDWYWPLALAFVKAAVALALVLRFGQSLMRRWLGWVAAQRSAEFFMLNVLLITIGMAAVSELLGLSMALGAFLAGMLIAETPYRIQVENDIRPFRDVLLGLFFITVGMFLDLGVAWQYAPAIAATLMAVLLVKLLVVWAASRWLGSDSGAALRSALWLATAGEFGFVLLSLGRQYELVPLPWQQIVATALVLSMLAAPLVVAASDRLVLRLVASEWSRRSLQLTQIAARAMRVKAPVLILGYGRTGQHLARLLEHEGIAFIAVDHDPERVKRAQAAGENVVYGDASRPEILKAAGLTRARAVVISFADRHAALGILELVRQLRPDVPVVVRARDEADIERMFDAGASEVIPEAIEVAVMMAVQTLVLTGQPIAKVMRRLRQLRAERYGLLRGYFSGASDAEDATADSLTRLDTFVVSPDSPWLGQRLGAVGLKELDVEVVAVRRRGIRGAAPDEGFVLQAGDVLILRGEPPALEAARDRLYGGQ